MEFHSYLRDYFLSCYADDPEVVSVLLQIDFSKLNHKFKKELLSNTDEDTLEAVGLFYNSPAFKEYQKAFERASMAVTKDLAMLMMFVEDNGMYSDLH